MDMINQTVGDSLSDMLMVEAILHAKGWDVPEWSRAYQVCRMNFILLFYPIFIATKVVLKKKYQKHLIISMCLLRIFQIVRWRCELLIEMWSQRRMLKESVWSPKDFKMQSIQSLPSSKMDAPLWGEIQINPDITINCFL